MNRLKLLVPWLFLPAIVILSGGIFVYWMYDVFSHCAEGEEIVATLDAGHARTITVYALADISDSGSVCSRERRYLLYKVNEGGQLLTSNAWFGTDEDGNHQGHAYSLRYAENRDLVGLVDGASPPILEAVFDFGTGDMWPEPILMGVSTPREKWMSLFLRLQKENPDVVIPNQ